MRPEVSLTKLDLYRLRQKTEDRTHFGPEMEQTTVPIARRRAMENNYRHQTFHRRSSRHRV